MKKETSDKQKTKKKYTPPVLTEYGSVRQFTRTTSQGTRNDRGVAPASHKEMCIASVSALEEHRILLADSACQELFREAISKQVRPGDIVLDLGTGTGLHAFFACQAGAKKVYAIDSDTVIELAKEAAAENGFSDNIEFIYGDSADIELPEKVDVIITNTGFLGTLKSLPDASRRFLKPRGRLIPERTQFFFVPVETTTLLDEKITTWNNNKFGLDFSSFFPYAANRPQMEHFLPKDYLAIAQPGFTANYREETENRYHWEGEFAFERDGVFCGLSGWYEFTLAEGVTLSTKPPLALAPELWVHPFLPSDRPITVRAGETVKASLDFYPTLDPSDPMWAWKFELASGEKVEQHSFNSIPLSKKLLSKLNSDSSNVSI